MRTFGFLGMLLVAGLGLVAPAEARDRPGTPNKQVLYICDYPAPNFPPVLCANFNNTTQDVVHIEVETTRNGQPYALYPNTFTCKGINVHETKTSHGDYFTPAGEICYSPTASYGRKPNDPDFVYYLQTPPLDWNTQYCMRFRARRVSDGVVSERWSDYACQNVPPKPPAPARPDFSVSFSGSQMYGQAPGAAAQPGQTAQVIPTKLIITPSASSATALYQLTLNGAQMQQWAGPGGANHSYDLGGNQTSVTVALCGYNASGRACVSHDVNLIAQGVMSTTPPRYFTPKPARGVGFNIATRPPMAVQSTLFMSGIDMPGNDYSSKPITGTAVDCQNMCNADGKCLSWTWVKPGVQSSAAMCWLKNAVPAQRQNPNATSGIKAGSSAVH